MSDQIEVTREMIEAGSEAVRREMRTLNIRWFADDCAAPEDAGRDTTPYSLLAEAAYKAMVKALRDAR